MNLWFDSSREFPPSWRDTLIRPVQALAQEVRACKRPGLLLFVGGDQ